MGGMGTQTQPNEIHFGYIVELEKYAFDESEGNSSWIQAFPYGEWSHPEYGKIRMNADRAARMAAGINQGIRDQDLPINYDHGEQRKDAAGWIQRADVRPDGLWLNVEWTREAYDKIKNKGYKYFSPEYANSWEHPASGQKFKDVFFGGALTNMPHLKGILPLNLAEYVKVEPAKSELRSFLESFATLHGLKFSESTTDDALKTEVTKKFAAMKTSSINDLPDSAFAYIEPGGKKDSEGKTTPRSLRHFPIHDASHVRNALARLSQSSYGPKAKSKVVSAAKRFGIKTNVAVEQFEESGSVMLAFCDADWTSVELLDLTNK